MAPRRHRRIPDGVLLELRMSAEELPVGVTANGRTCPFCSGGSSGEKSFTITRLDESLCKYICFRASCGAHGSLSGTSSSYLKEDSGGGSGRSRNIREHRELFSSPVLSLGDQWETELSDRYGISKPEAIRHGWCETVDDGRLVVYIRNRSGLRRGVHTRSHRDPRSGSITRDYRESEEPWVGWFPPSELYSDKIVLLVEDVFSAAKVAMAGYLAGSLMGSNLAPDQLEDCRSATDKQKRTFLALDRDATDKSFKLVSKYSFLMNGNLVPLLLSKDLKYESIDEIRRKIEYVSS